MPTSWNASFNDVVSVTELDPNEIGIDPLPDEVRDQWIAAVNAVNAIAGSKALGVDTKVNVELSGTATPGHTEADQISITITSSSTSAYPEVDSSAAAGPTVFEQSGPTPEPVA